MFRAIMLRVYKAFRYLGAGAKEDVMRSLVRKTFMSMAGVGLLFTAGCTSNDELERLRADIGAARADINATRAVANQALSAAQAAQQRADAAAAAAQAAGAAAQAAQAAADRAQAAAQNANTAIQADRAERARQPVPRGGRGERG